MATYFDSSVLISILIKDSFHQKALSLWETHEQRVASYLLVGECLNVLRRLAKRKAFDPKTIDQKITRLDQMMAGISFIAIDHVVLETLRNEPLTSECKSLDALHLASALVFKKHAPAGFAFCTFDTNLSLIANKLGFVVP